MSAATATSSMERVATNETSEQMMSRYNTILRDTAPRVPHYALQRRAVQERYEAARRARQVFSAIILGTVMGLAWVGLLLAFLGAL